METNKRAKYADNDEDDDDFLPIIVNQFLQMSTSMMDDTSSSSDSLGNSDNEINEDNRHLHKKNLRTSRRHFDHQVAKNLIYFNYLGPSPLFNDKQFYRMLRLSRSRFQRMMEDFAASGISFFSERDIGASLEARLMLPLKTLAYGVATHTFSDFFQMSPEFCRQCCLEFDKGFRDIYATEYLRRPDAEDLKSIVQLHKDVHNVDGMFGSIDCSHTVWKNCPKAWQGSFKGKEKKSTIVMEALCDFNLYIWHVGYGFAGTLNDKSILNRSPLLDSFTDGSFAKLEKAAGVVPFSIGGDEFSQLFCLGDGIYPNLSRIVKGIKEPTNDAESRYTSWQEGARKDIERAFGVLQGSFKFTAVPIQMHNLRDISARMATCIMLHNMKVSDRVNGGDVRTRYNPSKLADFPDIEVMMGHDEEEVMEQQLDSDSDNDDFQDNSVTYVTNWLSLTDETAHARLYEALLKEFG